VVCVLELKYGANYIEMFAFKQLAHYVHYEALDVYKQHSLKILGITSQTALQAAIAHHGIMLNNPNLIPTSINLFPQQFIITIANIPPTIDASTFADLWGSSFEFLSWNFW
jgi:hypothetical protein